MSGRNGSNVKVLRMLAAALADGSQDFYLSIMLGVTVARARLLRESAHARLTEVREVRQ